MSEEQCPSLVLSTILGVDVFVIGRESSSGFPALFPLVSVRLHYPGESLCPACHERAHPSCRSVHTLVREEDMKCLVCLKSSASIVCPACPSVNDDGHIGLTLCKKCCIEIHQIHKSSHSDHFYSLPVLTKDNSS